MKHFLLFLLACSLLAAAPAEAAGVGIQIWYGDVQHFGKLGHPQRWVNILGSVESPDKLASLTYSLNGAAEQPLSYREDRKRIGRDGDFNLEIARARLQVGANKIIVIARTFSGSVITKKLDLNYYDHAQRWPLPYRIDWSGVVDIQDVAQVVDGKWQLSPGGVRAIEPYYDRIIAFGDDHWRDYEVTTTVTIHAVTAPRVGSNNTGVTHAAIALRWPGHDADGKQPSVKWHPLGATAEFRLGGDLQQCRWRIFDGNRKHYVESRKRRAIEFDRPYRMKHRVETLADGTSRYRVKLWPSGEPEPTTWDLERIEPDDLESGSALLIAHHAEVTFGNVSVVPVGAASVTPKTR